MAERMVLIPLSLAERPHSKQELARMFEVDDKTIWRDLQALSLHYPIADERDGREVIYRFMDGYEYHPPNFTPTELATLLLAQQSIAATGVTSFGTPFAGYGQTLLQKVRSALPQSLRDKLDALATIFGAAVVPAKDYAPHADTIDRLTTAAVERRRVQMRYHSLNSNQITERHYDPYAVYFDPDGATLKVIGRDHKAGARNEPIPLSVDRILSLTLTDQLFELPPEWNLSDFLTENCFNGIHGQPLTVRLRAFGVTARIFAERTFHASQQTVEKLKRHQDGQESIVIEMRVAGGRGLERFIQSWLPEIEVLDPPELSRKIAETLKSSLAGFAPSAPPGSRKKK
jgi:predicted DNA-binding transcriptional regulator YafY